LFHASQIDGIPPFTAPTDAEAPWRAPDAAETILANSGITIRIGGGHAYSAPATDVKSWLEVLHSDRKEIFRAGAEGLLPALLASRTR
jgi:antirestriction protein ArdC